MNNLKNKFNLETKEAVGLLILMIMTFAGVIGTLIGFAKAIAGSDSGSFLSAVALLVLYGMMIYYSMAGYKKPHGNLLKIMLLVFSAAVAINALDASGISKSIVLYLCMAIVIIASHMAGILNRYDRCKILFIVVLALTVLAAILDLSTAKGIDIFVMFSFPVLWLDIFRAYVTRYKEHKEAGESVKAE